MTMIRWAVLILDSAKTNCTRVTTPGKLHTPKLWERLPRLPALRDRPQSHLSHLQPGLVKRPTARLLEKQLPLHHQLRVNNKAK